jgi:hypothetical protein
VYLLPDFDQGMLTCFLIGGSGLTFWLSLAACVALVGELLDAFPNALSTYKLGIETLFETALPGTFSGRMVESSFGFPCRFGSETTLPVFAKPPPLLFHFEAMP